MMTRTVPNPNLACFPSIGENPRRLFSNDLYPVYLNFRLIIILIEIDINRRRYREVKGPFLVVV